MKKVLIVNYCAYIPGEKAIKRTFYLFQMMKDAGYDVTFLTSNFNHYEKKVRDVNAFYEKYPEYKNSVQFVNMDSYDKNISLKRFRSNYKCEEELIKWFAKNIKEYDLVYVSWPMYKFVNKIRKYCDKYGIKLVIDVNDLWPDSLKMVIKSNFVYNALTWPIQRKTKKAFSYADGIVAVSQEYLNIASNSNKRATEKLVVYIGAMLDKFDEGIKTHASSIEKKDGEFWITYIGTLGKSYDIDTVIRAVTELRKEKGIDIRFKILGQGPTESGLKKLATELDSDGIDFIGFQEYGKMAAYLSKTDVCVNCIKARASQSIINKAADYFASKKPVLNCGPCVEMRDLIEKYNTGINYVAENVESLKNAIYELYVNPEKRTEMGKNSRLLAEDKFDRHSTHKRIIDMIDRI